MSDPPKEAERNLEPIYICNDIYLDVFRLLSPAKVGLELALVSRQFDALVDTQFKSRKWTIGKLRIYEEDIIKLTDGGSEKTLAFPQEPLPSSVVGFSSVGIYLINSDVIAFLQRICRLLESDVYLNLNIYGEKKWSNFTTSVWPLINLSAIIKLHFSFPSVIHQNFRRLTSPSILCDCSNVRVISLAYDYFLQFPPQDIEGSSDGQALCKWLHTPREDGKPKVLGGWGGDDFPLDALKKSFLNATTSVSFFIRLRSITSAVRPVKLVNSLTREQLTTGRIRNDGRVWLIERSPIDKSADQWAKWKREAMNLGEYCQWKTFSICL